MLPEVNFRSTEVGDIGELERLYPQAFAEEDLLAIMRALVESIEGVESLVALQDGQIIGHIVFTRCALANSTNVVYLLGPLAVAPSMQRRGIGKALIAEGHERLHALGASHVYVLGDPAYYSRSGFLAENQVDPPYPLPAVWDGAWQSQALTHGTASLSGRLIVPAVWDDPALWLP